ncbi:MAG TPA: acetate--CoA ligase family protein [Candidatus Binataceae bacterium]
MLAEAVGAGRGELSEIESKQILDALGIPVAVAHLARNADEAADLAARVGFPAALKVLSPQAVHKSEVRGVELALASPAEVRAAFERIRQNLAARRPDARFDGVAVQAMAPAGIEMIVGVTRDDRFGALVIVGVGGTLVEILKDTVLRVAPVTAAGARAMLDGLRGAAILRGIRGGKPADLDALSGLIARASTFAAEHPEVREMDLNPVAAYPDGVRVLDARILLDGHGPLDGRMPLDAAGAQPAANADPHHAQRIDNLRRAFDARAVAVIGDKRAGGYLWLRAMARFSRKLYSVQIDPNEIPGIEAMGIANVKSLAEVPEPIDYAVSAVPRQVAPRILKDCIAAGVRGIGFFTSGFSETGEEAGVRLERELRAAAAESDIALVGPNCMGLYNPSIGLCNFPDLATGAGGDVCFISQSGTHSINFCMQAPIRGLRINKAASIGNVLMLEAADYLDVMADDPATRAIGMYLEGVRDGRRFLSSLKRAAARHPVVVWKGGTTDAGGRASFSHTGSLATAAAVWRAVMTHSGAVSVASLDAMLDAMELLARGRRVGGRGMGLVAMTGGQSVVITDTFASAGLEVPALSADSYAELKGFFNIIGGSYRNPLDAGGTIGMGHDQGNLDRILDILERDSAIDAIVLEIGTGLRAARWASHEDELTGLLDKLAEFNRRSRKAFAVILHPAHVELIVTRARELARGRGLVVFESFERAAAAFAAAAEYWQGRAAS